MNGLILIDKPGGLTSHDVVNRWRRLAGTKRVGHLGTLDPMATGLLVLVSGLATRLAPFFGKDEKTYQAEVTLGLTSDTYDAEGVITNTGCPPPQVEAIGQALSRFEGAFLQMPPPVSAKKVGGVAAYKLARNNVDFALKPVPVEVKDLTWQMLDYHRIGLEVTCTAGTYIRGIAHDLGRALGCGALLSKLRRTRVAGLSVDSAHSLEELAALAAAGQLAGAMTPMGAMLPELPAAYVDEDVERAIRQGRDFRTSPFTVPLGASTIRALSRFGELVAIGELRFPNVYHPKIVL